MVCELCGSNEFTKDNDGLFVCDYCRTKYTAEQAKSMLVEGTVKINRDSEALNLIALAKSALDLRDTVAALDYANRALEIDPENSSAWFCKGLIASLQLDDLQEVWLSSLGIYATTKIASMGTLDDPPWVQVVGSFRKAIDHAPPADQIEITNDSASALYKMARKISELSFDTFNKTGWMEENYLAHTDRCRGVIAAHFESFEMEAKPDPLEQIADVATRLISGIKYKTDAFWPQTVKLSKTEQVEFEQYIQDATRKKELLGEK